MPEAAVAAAAAAEQQVPRPSAEAASLEQLSISGDDEGAAAAFGSPVDVDTSPLLAGVHVWMTGPLASFDKPALVHATRRQSSSLSCDCEVSSGCRGAAPATCSLPPAQHVTRFGQQNVTAVYVLLGWAHLRLRCLIAS